MKNRVITSAHKEPTVIPVAQVVELGTATSLTLGHGNTSCESSGRPYGWVTTT